MVLEYINRKVAQFLIVTIIIYFISMDYLDIISLADDLNEEYNVSTLESEEYHYNIDVAWGRMSFVYDKGIWDTDELKYKSDSNFPSKDTIDGEPGWYDFDGENNKISIINCSKLNSCNYEIYVDNNVRYNTEDDTDYTSSEISGVNLLFYDDENFSSGGVDNEIGVLDKATDTLEPEVSYFLSVDGIPDGLTSQRKELGSVVVKVSKPNTFLLQASLAMNIEADDEVIKDSFDIVTFNVQDLLAYNYGLEENYGPESSKYIEIEEVATSSNASSSNAHKSRTKSTESDSTEKSLTEDEVAVKITLPRKLKRNLLDYSETVGEYDEDSGIWTLGKGETSGSLELMFEYPDEDTYKIQARVGHLNENGKFRLGLSEESEDNIVDNTAIKEIQVVEEKIATPSNATPSNATPSNASPSDATPSNATPSDIDDSDIDDSDIDDIDIENKEDIIVSEATPSELDYEEDENIKEKELINIKEETVYIDDKFKIY